MSTNTANSTRTCSRCGREGHDRRICGRVPPVDQRMMTPRVRAKSDPRLCSKCHAPGHYARTCDRRLRPDPETARPDVPLEVAREVAAPIVSRLREVLNTTAAYSAYVDPLSANDLTDSVLLSCYLLGMLDGAERAMA